MHRLLLLFGLLVVACPRLWGQAASIGQEEIGISSGTRSVNVRADGSLDVTCVGGCSSSVGESTTAIRGASGNILDVNGAGEMEVSIQSSSVTLPVNLQNSQILIGSTETLNVQGTVTALQQAGSTYTVSLASAGNFAAITSSGLLKVETTQAPGQESKVNIIDSTNGFEARVDDLGRLLVSQVVGDIPNTTPVEHVGFNDVSTSSDTTFTITAGSTLTVSFFQLGCEIDTTAGSKVELYEDDDGTGSTLTLIAVGFCSGSNQEFTLSNKTVGDGSRAIRMRRERMSGGAKEIFGRWSGFEIP